MNTETIPERASPEVVAIASAVVTELRNRGPLCVSQLSADLRVAMKWVREAITLLEHDGYVVPRNDVGVDTPYDALETPYGLKTVL